MTLVLTLLLLLGLYAMLPSGIQWALAVVLYWWSVDA